MAVPGDWKSKDSLNREYDAYQLASIAESDRIRAMYDFIGNPEDLTKDSCDDPPGLVLEWFDSTLRQLPCEMYGKNPVLLHAIVKAGLLALNAFASEGRVHTDIKPDNVLLSHVNSTQPTVKIGDLGEVQRDGYDFEAQPFAMRAPEVYRGVGCFHRSDIWSLAATLLCWLNPSVLGNHGNKYGLVPEGWCIAKLMQLFPGWNGPPVDDEVARSFFDLAEALVIEKDPEKPDQRVVKVMTLEDEMHKMGLCPVLKRLFHSLFIVDHEARPSAAQVLSSSEFLALKMAADSSNPSETLDKKYRSSDTGAR